MRPVRGSQEVAEASFPFQSTSSANKKVDAEVAPGSQLTSPRRAGCTAARLRDRLRDAGDVAHRVDLLALR